MRLSHVPGERPSGEEWGGTRQIREAGPDPRAEACFEHGEDPQFYGRGEVPFFLPSLQR